MARKLLISILLLIFSLNIVQAQVSVTREISMSKEGELSVKLKLEVGSQRPGGIIIVERVPEGVEYISSTPEAVFNPSTRELKWVFYGEGVKNREVIYNLSVPSAFQGEILFSGELKTLAGVEEIGGETKFTIKIKEAGEKERGEGKGVPFPGIFAISAGMALVILFRKRLR